MHHYQDGVLFVKATRHMVFETKVKENCINALELLAAFLAIKCFTKDNQDCQILLRIDNVVAISYINRMGRVKFPYLNEITRSVWDWCIHRNTWIFAEYVVSKDNPADRESRISNLYTEWELAEYTYNVILKQFGYWVIGCTSRRTIMGYLRHMYRNVLL